MTTLNSLTHQLRQRLTPVVGEGEARAMIRLIVEHLWGYTPMLAVFHGDDEVSDFRQRQMHDIVQQVIDGRPLQYVLGTARFMGNDFRVTPDTLIPRPETAGLIDLAVDALRGRSDLRILDIGTGTGIIAIMLARALHFARVEAVDVSPGALAVARENAKALKVKLSTAELDILTTVPPSAPCYDLVISNPPYIAQHEQDQMEPRVWAHEPRQALFVPDDDPLLFYRSIGLYARQGLVDGGYMMCEINPLFASDLRQMLTCQGYDDVQLHRDYCGKWRYVTAKNS